MVRTQIYLTEQEHRQLHRLSRRKGTSLSELIRAAIDQMLSQHQSANRVEAMRQARGIWKDRTDLPDFTQLRREWDRTSRT
jgi:metal-responsive CopG/Arc/MetJ family transcriptional regulator